MKTQPNLTSGLSTRIAAQTLLALVVAATAGPLYGQGLVASGQITDIETSPGVYQYTLTIMDAGTATLPVASFWYAWTPGSFYLPSAPTSAGGNADWTAHIFGDSIQFSANSAAADITPGTSQTFTYVASFTPQVLAAAPNNGLSVAYAGALQSTPSENFTVVAAPEPSTLTLLSLGLGGLCLAARRNRLRTGTPS